MSLASHSIRADTDYTDSGALASDRYASGLKDTTPMSSGGYLSSSASPMQPTATDYAGTTSNYPTTSSYTMGKEYIASEPGLGQRVPAAAHVAKTTAKSTWQSIMDTLQMWMSPVLSFAQPLINAAWGAINWGLSLVGGYWRALPALRAFVYAFGALTLIPNAMFLGFVGIAAAVVLGTALTISSFILAGVAGFGLLFLAPVLFFSFWGALIGVGLWQLSLYGLRASAVSLGAAQSLTTGPSGQGIVGSALGMAKSAAAVSADMLEKVEAVAVGGDGLPAPISGRV